MNLSMLLTKTARKVPDKLALVHKETRLTYREFNARCNRLANAFLNLGLKQGDNVAILQYNYPQTFESIFACFKAGICVVPINFRLHPKEFAFIINHSNAKAVILSHEFNETILEVQDRFPDVQNLITLTDSNEKLLDYEALLDAESDRFSDADVLPDDLAWLFYTSGTTGMPKGAMLTHRNLLAMTMNFYVDIAPGFSYDEVVLHAAPLSHGSGLYSLPNIGKGATNVILGSKSFDPELVFKTIEECRVTNMFVAPTMIKILMDSTFLNQYDQSSLKAMNYGGAPMLVEDMKTAIQKLGPCLVQLFGQGESPMTISYLPQCDHVPDGSKKQMARLASAGIPRTDVEIKIVDEEYNELASGEIGEIITRSDLVMKGYWRNPKATKETLKHGWLKTGDMGYMDENGYLYIKDRSKDMVISGGENIYPREIEEVLIQHPAVREVSVIGVPDPKWGEVLKAVVALVTGESATQEELISFCKDNIASYKKPKSIDFVDELPKSNYGKILKRELRAKYIQDKNREV